MPAKIGSVTGDRHVMARSGRDLPVAARADIDLGGSIGLNALYLDGAVQAVPDPLGP